MSNSLPVSIRGKSSFVWNDSESMILFGKNWYFYYYYYIKVFSVRHAYNPSTRETEAEAFYGLKTIQATL